MPGPINSIFASVTARLAQWRASSSPTDLPYSTAATWCHLNATHLAEAAVPPRIVWVPLAESFGPAMGQGGDATGNPRPVATRQSQFEVHIWAAADPQTGQANQNALDLDACELLLNAFMWAVYSKVHGAPAQPFLGTGRWSRGNVDGQLLTLGQAYILPLTIYIPVTRPVEAVAEIATVDATVAFPNDSEEIVLT